MATTADAPTTTKRIGRRPKGEGKRQNYTFRMNEKTRDLLVKAAEEAGHSLSEEIEKRIVQRTFTDRDLVQHAILEISFGSRKVAKLFEILGVIARVAELRTGQDPDIDENTFEAIRLAAIRYLSTASAYMTPESRTLAADPETVSRYAEEIADLARRIFHERDRDKLKGDLPLWARPDDGFA
jgi:hypothetical protein